MDEMCNKSEVENSSNKITDVVVTESVKRCGSPVFKCINHTKGLRLNNLDSSDYDIPSYQINQSAKSRTSSKYGSETSESVLPFSPVFSPIPIATTVQFQPPSIHSLGTVAKVSDKSCMNSGNGFPSVNRDAVKSCGLFESLGMNDKDVSWVSSMASPPPKQVPGSQFNTIEKATFLPEEKFQNIQPRALFSPDLDDDFGCHPISFCSESEDEEAYKSNIRLSDVCATLKQLEVRSLDQQSDHSVENLTLLDNSLVSPVIRTKKPESVKKKKKGVLVVSPDEEHTYEFSVGESKVVKCDKSKSDDGSNFLKDDSFQNISFSGIDELCKTLVTEGSNSSAVSKSGLCDKTLTNSSSISSTINIPKIYYNSKLSADVYEVSSVSDLHSYAKALEEGDFCIGVEEGDISTSSKISKSFVEKGIVRLDVLNKNSAKTDATKRLHSEVTEEKDEEKKEKLRKMDDENTEWEKMKQYLSESQLNVSDGEIFRTVENLEKTLASQESKEKISVLQETELSLSQSSSSTTSKANTERTGDEEEKSERGEAGWKATTEDSMLSIAFTNVLGSRISVSMKSLDRGREILKDCDKECRRQQKTDELVEKGGLHEDHSDSSGLKKQNNVSAEQETPKETFEESNQDGQTECFIESKENVEAFFEGFSTGTGKKVQVCTKSLEIAKALMRECDEDPKETTENNFLEGFSTGSGKKIRVSAKSLEKAKTLMRECDEDPKETTENNLLESFSTGTGKKVGVSAKSLEKAKALMRECDEDPKEISENNFLEGFSTGTGKKVRVCTKSLEIAKALMRECDEDPKETSENNFLEGFSTGTGKKVQVCTKSLEIAKTLMRECDEEPKEISENNFLEGFSTGTGKKVGVSAKSLEIAKALMRECDEDPKETTEHYFLEDFSTGSGKKIRVSAKSLEKAKTLMRECDEDPKETTENNFLEGFSTGTGKKVGVSAKSLEIAKALMRECDEDPKDTAENNFLEGFSTGSGKKIRVSAKSLEKAKTLMRECDEDPKESSETNFLGFSTGSGKKIQVCTKSLEKAKALMKEYDESLTEKQKAVETNFPTSDQTIETSEKSLEEEKTDRESIQTESRERTENHWMKGFTTSSGKAIQVSAKALKKAKALMRECDESSEETPERVGNSLMEGFSMFSGAKIQVSAKALEKAKTLWADCEENVRDGLFVPKGSSTCFGKSISVSGEAEEKAKALTSNIERELIDTAKKTTDGSDAKAGFGFSTATGTEVKEALEKAKSLRVKNEESVGEAEEIEVKKEGPAADVHLTEDWEEIIPAWLHVYTTSPPVASDRADLTPVLAHEDGQSSRAPREYIVKSPVLGASDRFHGRRKRRRLRFEEENTVEDKTRTGFAVPYKEPDRKAGGKRTSGPAMDFSAPFKKAKFVEETAAEAGRKVKEDRARRREEQERATREKNKVKPSEGSHLRRKTSQKQMSWMEAVGGSPPEIYSEEALKSFGVREDVLRVTIENAVSFTFDGDIFGPNRQKNVEEVPAGDGCHLIPDDENRIGASECKRGFLASAGVQPSLVPEGWVENHYKWIVWKLAHYERSFPGHFAGRCLTPDNVMLQLKYRYDREIDRSERSALKKILERDDTPAKRLVLCVCGIEKTEVGDGFRYELSLTDGWYSCPARVDPAMTRILDEGKLSVGTKVMTQGAVLVNCEQGVSPLEIGGDVHLRISTNSTRRIRWDAKLGFQKNPRNFPISLGSILAQGGQISRIDIIIVRVYPVLYMEKTSDGCHVTRNRRSEEKAEAEYRKLQEKKMEAICTEVRMEMRKSADSEKKTSRLCLNNLERVEDMCELMETSSDPSSLQELMTTDQRKTLENCLSNQNDRFSRVLSEKIEKKLEKENLLKRNVSELFRAKIVDLRKPDYNNPAVLSVWHPNEDLIALLSEGKAVSLSNVTISNSSRVCKPLQINTMRQTQYVSINRSVKYPSRKVTSLRDVSSRASPVFEEVDVVGMVVLVRDISYGSRLSQVVYLTDAEGHYAGVVFWGSCKNYGWENALRVRCVVACTNLQWKKTLSPQDVPSLYVSENSVFTENPKQSYMKEEMEKLKQTIPQDVSDFLSKCEEDLLTKLEESKWRSNLQRKSSVAKCGAKGSDGFGSRPTASSTPIKPLLPSSSATTTTAAAAAADDAEPSPIQKRVERLQRYGEPPALLPLIARNNLRRSVRQKSSLASTSR